VTDRDESVTGGDEGALAEPPPGHTSRRRFLQGAAGATGVLGASLAAPGVFYKMADAIAAPPARPAAGARAPAQEQYLLQDTRVVNVDGSGLQRKHGSVAVHVPPLHDHVITAKLNVPASPAALREAQRHLVDRPGNLGGSDTWEDSESWWHSGSIPRSCVNAR
jgi:hypothetical protein